MGGVYLLPVDLIVGGGDTWIVLWANPGTQQILGHAVLSSWDPKAAAQSFLETMKHPQDGRPGPFASVRIADHEVAEALRLHTNVEVMEGPTPEVDAIANHFMASSLPPDIALTRIPDALAGSFFAAAASLYRLQPWRHVPSDSAVLRLSIEALGVSNAILSVIGHAGESYGVLVFSSAHDFLSFTSQAEAGIHPTMLHDCFPIMSVTFSAPEPLVEPLLARAKRAGWDIAGPRAIPRLGCYQQSVPQRTTPDHILQAIALCKGMSCLIESHPGLISAWTAEQRIDDEYLVDTAGKRTDVRLQAPVAEIRAWLPPEVARSGKV